MQITVEISFYPLNEGYGTEVLGFITLLKKDTDLEIRTNSLSTQITGEFDAVMQQVNRTLKESFMKGYKATAVLKIFNEGLELDWLKLPVDSNVD